MQTHESYESATQKKSWRSGGQHFNWLCKTWRLNGFRVVHTKPNQLIRRREVFDNSFTQKKTLNPFIRTSSMEYIEACEEPNWKLWEIYAAQIRNTWNCRNELHDEWKKALRPALVQSGLQKKAGGQKQWSVIAISENVQDLPSRWPDALWTVVQLMGPIIPCGEEVKILPYIFKRPPSSAPVRYNLNIYGLCFVYGEQLDWWL